MTVTLIDILRHSSSDLWLIFAIDQSYVQCLNCEKRSGGMLEARPKGAETNAKGVIIEAP